MKYVNKHTGAVIDITNALDSEYWEQVKEPAPVSFKDAEVEVKTEAPPKKTRKK